jgi:hypothetical protein
MHKGFKCHDISEGRIYISRDVFDETIFPFSNLHSNDGTHCRSEVLLPDWGMSLEANMFYDPPCASNPIGIGVDDFSYSQHEISAPGAANSQNLIGTGDDANSGGQAPDSAPASARDPFQIYQVIMRC